MIKTRIIKVKTIKNEKTIIVVTTIKIILTTVTTENNCNNNECNENQNR